jgi:hypothetical protein
MSEAGPIAGPPMSSAGALSAGSVNTDSVVRVIPERDRIHSNHFEPDGKWLAASDAASDHLAAGDRDGDRHLCFSIPDHVPTRDSLDAATLGEGIPIPSLVGDLRRLKRAARKLSSVDAEAIAVGFGIPDPTHPKPRRSVHPRHHAGAYS